MHRFGMEACGLVLALAGVAAGQVTQRMSVGPAGVQANNASYQASVSAD